MIIGGSNCGSCLYFMRVSKDKAVCRREPPKTTPIVAVTPKGPQVLGEYSSHTITLEDMWCGEYKRKLVEGVELVSAEPAQ